MQVILNSSIFIFGLIVGSFLNCIIYRLEKKKSFLRGRSFCPSCKHVLAWYDLIPVLSFFFLQAKCHYCKKKISWQYPLVELATGVFFLIFFLYYGFLAVYYWLIFCFLMVIFVYDLKHFIIPDSAIFPAIILTLVYTFLTKPLIPFVLSGFLAACFFLAIFLVSRGKWLGFGDVKLVFFMGLFLGSPQIIVALFFSFAIGAIIGIILILLRKKGLKSEIPFGPFLVIGTYIAFFASDKIINWYFSLFI